MIKLWLERSHPFENLPFSKGLVSMATTSTTTRRKVMKFLNNLVVAILAAIRYRWERITLNLPFRMAVGRFGIRLMEFGRILQVRYANWNGEFRLKNVISPDNTDFCTINVSEEVTSRTILSFDSRDSQPQERTPMVCELFNVKGVRTIYLKPYEISVIKGSVFSWREVLPDVERVILKHLAAV